MSRVTVVVVLLAAVAIAACILCMAGVIPYRLYVIHTGSMDPALPVRSAAIVRVGEYEVGEPVTFVSNGEVVTHRLLKLNSDGTITTKGDANRSEDPNHPPVSNIIGGVVAGPHYLGWIWVFLFWTPGGLSVLLSFLAIWLSICFVRTFKEPDPDPAPQTLASATA